MSKELFPNKQIIISLMNLLKNGFLTPRVLFFKEEQLFYLHNIDRSTPENEIKSIILSGAISKKIGADFIIIIFQMGTEEDFKHVFFNRIDFSSGKQEIISIQYNIIFQMEFLKHIFFDRIKFDFDKSVDITQNNFDEEKMFFLDLVITGWNQTVDDVDTNYYKTRANQNE